MDLAHAVEMHDEGHPRRRLEPVEALLEPKRVGAQLDRLAHLDHPGGDLFDPLEDERLAAADRDDGGGALQPGIEALLDAEARAVRLVLADLSAADAGDVARERRLEHQDERVALALPLLRGDVLADRTSWTAVGTSCGKPLSHPTEREQRKTDAVQVVADHEVERESGAREVLFVPITV